MSSHEALSAASNDRKARLAQLKSLKRKQAPSTNDTEADSSSTTQPSTDLTTTSPETNDTTTTYLSGRNFDPSTRNVKLGFDAPPIADPTSTLEYKAAQLALSTAEAQAAEKDDTPLDLFKLQPKKPNWDLKRDLAEKSRPLDVQTENAIARMVRGRIEASKGVEKEREKVQGGNEGDGEQVGIEGVELVEAMKLKEVEDERERRREAEEDDEGGS
jgi:coiled-coil domain-containing protein 12